MHVQKHFSNPFKCESCEKKFLTEVKLQIHIKNTHPDYFKCNICEITCNDEKDFEKHKKKHEDKFNCEECGKKFLKQCYLQRHIDFIHKGN